ncbi:MAG: PEP/pyruvate-binding domain-containing protein, partial [Bacteroidota bacterium]
MSKDSKIIQSLSNLEDLKLANKVNSIILSNKGEDETIKTIVDLINQTSRQHGRDCLVRILFRRKEYKTRRRKYGKVCFEKSFRVSDREKGNIQLCYVTSEPLHGGDHSVEKEQFVIIIAHLLTTYFMGQFNKREQSVSEDKSREDTIGSSISLAFLQRFLNKSTDNRDVYHDLMPFTVKEILLISSLYDAYAIDREGRFSEHMLGQYGQLNLTSFPRITGVSSMEQALKILRSKHFDLIIYMVGVDKRMPLVAGTQIKKRFPYIPIYLLVNNTTDLAYFRDIIEKNYFADRIFTWNGNANVFFSMIKILEDEINLANDTTIGKVRVILLVEDNPDYYSRYLTFLYKVVMEQTRRIIDDVVTDALYKVLRLRARPKIVLATNYEDAVEIIDKYNEYLVCLITDVKYMRKGKMDEDAGIKLMDYTRKVHKNLPTIIQSSDTTYKKVARKRKVHFIAKNSKKLLKDFHDFITNYLGFGDFIFKDKSNHELSRATNIMEFEEQLKTIPDESLLYHAKRDHFSMWLMARGEIKAASIINPKKVGDYESLNAMRLNLLDLIKEHRSEQEAGNIIPYQLGMEIVEEYIYSLADGSLGGKGRGLAFIDAFIHDFDFTKELPNIIIRTPKTLIIGTKEFEQFISHNDLGEFVVKETKYQKIRKKFMASELSEELTSKLRELLISIEKPVAVRSSGLFEDSIGQPFAGIFETYLLPNSHIDFEVRLQHVLEAIKLVYASVYSPTAKGYIKAINYNIDDERMAVVIQEVVGNKYDNHYYPHISGVAQSYNFYPFARMKPEEGFAVAAVGLGRYVVEGQKAYRFSPRYPQMEINSSKDQFKNSQVKFYSINLDSEHLNLLEGEEAALNYDEIYLAEKHGTLNHSVSVYNPDSDSMHPGITQRGPRITNFANILKYDYIPMAKAIDLILKLGRDAMGTPIEIEYAIDLNKDKKGRASFYILQIKPLISSSNDCEINMSKIDKKDMVLYTEKGMGNGTIENIHDIVFVDNNKFDKTKTEEIAAEMEELNKSMVEQDREYVLIGPGRWGTRDKFIGIPVNWYQISNATVIVETSLDDSPLDASSGSHFFHNVTSMNVGYFTVQHESKTCFI